MSVSQKNAWVIISNDTVLVASVLIKFDHNMFRVVFHCTDAVTIFLQGDHSCAEQCIITEVVL